MNRTALGLAIGAGYVLGRTKKMKLAIAVGTMVAGKRLNLSPRALGEMVTTQLQNNPQFKEIGDQLREDLRGVGKAASGALVERQIEGLAGRLHSRTQGVRDQISGVAPDVDDVRDAGRKVTGVVPGSRGADDERAEDEPYDDAYPEEASYDEDKDRDDASYDETEDRSEAADEGEAENRSDEGDGRRRRSPARASGSGGEKRAATERASGKAPAKKKSAAAKATGGARGTVKTGRAASGAAKGGRSRG
ncbi:DNA primase [Streptomyces sp. NBC_00483]|uniref:DNA primase n=1 Tax=Streptomyces sp. NBC_00483 TaxID=2975756 RepID=UPI002E18CE98